MLPTSKQPLNVTYLLAVWGNKYINQFMDVSLPSLLASGNIPAVASESRSRFLFLTAKDDRKFFTQHPLFRRLERYCEVDFVAIDDLLFGSNYSATLTIAYERGMRQAGKEMCSTYFIYLVADYIMADGSLANLLPYMKRNVSGITGGNFQAVEEELLKAFEQAIDPVTGILTLDPRSLVGMSLPHLHPTSSANIVNQNYSHTTHTNRLFWRVDANTLVGRFYLRHMLCIKPEIDDYIIGASCDYSFIDAMCPSGNVAHITDSDEYCVVELQPFAHEQKMIAVGAPSERELAGSLGEWTTRTHRDNALHPIIFHADAIPTEAAPLVAHSQSFVENINSKLPPPQSSSSHPYWISCIEGILQQLVTPHPPIYAMPDLLPYLRNGIFAGIIGSPVFEPPLGHMHGDYNILRQDRYLYGGGPRRYVNKLKDAASTNIASGKIWHREYAQSRTIIKTIRQHMQSTETPLIMVAFAANDYAVWCEERFGRRVLQQQAACFRTRTPENIQAQAAGAGHAIILLPACSMHELGDTLEHCKRCLTGDKQITIIVTQRFFSPWKQPFKAKLAALSAYFDCNNMQLVSYHSISNATRKWVDPVYQRAAHAALASPLSLTGTLKRMLAIILLALTAIAYTAGNLTSRKRRHPKLGSAICAIIQLKEKP